MAESVHTDTSLLHATQLAPTLTLRRSPNGIRFTSYGETKLADLDLDRIVQAVPSAIAPALGARGFYFVPLTLAEAPGGAPLAPSDTLIASVYTTELSEDAICHRNVALLATPAEPAHEGVFISARLLPDNFALAFEFFINVGHAFAAEAGIPDAFATLAWSQAIAGVRGETSQDAWEARNEALLNTKEAVKSEAPGLSTTTRPAASQKRSLFLARRASETPAEPRPTEPTAQDEKAKLEFIESAYADALAIYQLSLAVDFDYSELREREYPLIAPAALAERLRLIAQLFPPNPGYDFDIRYRRRGA
jgi:hypothetical protein